MSDRYFRKFPLITYDGQTAVSINERAVILDSVLKNPYVYYPYDVADEERPDQLANRYYNDPNMTWIIYLANQIVDPYYEWYIGPREFDALIAKKYGTQAEAQQKIVKYRNNWYENPDNISVSRYNALSVGELKYYEPVYGSGNAVVAYKRKAVDWVIDTNQIVTYSANGTGLIKNERVRVSIISSDTGSGQVLKANSSLVVIQHTSGFVVANSVFELTANSVLTGLTSGVTSTITASAFTANNIPDTEVVYWSPVTLYDIEDEKNTKNRSIRLLDKRFASQTADALKQVLNA